MAEAIELGEVNKGVDGADEDEDEDATEETRLLGDNDDDTNLLNTSVPVSAGFNPDIVGESSRPSGSIPNVRRDAGTMRSSITYDKKKFLEKGLGIKLNKGGPGSSSAELFNNMKIRTSTNGKKTIGASYKGVKVIVQGKNGKMKISEDKTNASTINEFKELLEKAKIEYSDSASGYVAKKTKETQGVDPPNEQVNSVLENSIERMEDVIWSDIDMITGEKDMVISDSALREIRAPLFANEANIGVLEHLDTNAEHWTNLAEEVRLLDGPGREKEASLYEAVAEASKLKADQIRMRLNQRPEGERAQSIIEEEINNNELTRFEKFKKWAKENLGVISAIAISVGGIITTIVVGAKSAIAKGARATSNFAKGLASLAKKLGPVLGALLNIVAQILTLEAKGIGFLSKNLWILTIALAYFLYDKFKNRKKRN